MKTILRFFLFLLIAVAVFSCVKSSGIEKDEMILKEAKIQSKIYPYVSDPYQMTLGKSGSVFRTGEKIIVLIPYQIVNDEIVSGTLETSDAQSGGMIETYDLGLSTDPRFADISIPEELEGKPFMVGIITVNDGYLSKLINISSTINGAKTSSSDAVAHAFGVNE